MHVIAGHPHVHLLLSRINGAVHYVVDGQLHKQLFNKLGIKGAVHLIFGSQPI